MILNTKLIVSIVLAILVLASGYFVIVNNRPPVVPIIAPVTNSNQMNSMIDSQIAQYEILLRQNKMPDTCAMAKTIGMLYLQQEDEANYSKWDATAISCEEVYIESQTNTQI